MAKPDTDAPAKKSSPIILGAVFLVLTAAAIGGGWFAGTMLGDQARTASEQRVAAATEAGEEEPAATLALMPLAPITTNLAPPADVWARVEASLVFKEAADEAMAAAIHQDLLAFIRTVKAHQIEGPSGFRHFREDLENVARIRSEGKVERVLIRTLLFE